MTVRRLCSLAVVALATIVFLWFRGREDPIDTPPAPPRVLTSGKHTVEHDGLTREFTLYLPDSLSTDAPLVVALHGYGSSPEDAKASARDAFDAGNYADAEKHYAKALDGVAKDDAGYLALKVEHLQALAYVDGAKVLEQVRELKGQLSLRTTPQGEDQRWWL